MTWWIQQTWKDPRLEFGTSHQKDSVAIPKRLMEKLWVPGKIPLKAMFLFSSIGFQCMF